jgi:hypothetical protein
MVEALGFMEPDYLAAPVDKSPFDSSVSNADQQQKFMLVIS